MESPCQGHSFPLTARREGDPWHGVYTTTIDGQTIRRINDKGRAACSYYFPDGQQVVWTSTRDREDLPAGNYSDPRDYPQGAELYVSKAA